MWKYPVTCGNNLLLALVVQTSDSAIQRMITVQQISIRETDCLIRWIVIYAVDSVIHLLNNWGLNYKIMRMATLTPQWPISVEQPESLKVVPAAKNNLSTIQRICFLFIYYTFILIVLCVNVLYTLYKHLLHNKMLYVYTSLPITAA